MERDIGDRMEGRREVRERERKVRGRGEYEEEGRERKERWVVRRKESEG